MKKFFPLLLVSTAMLFPLSLPVVLAASPSSHAATDSLQSAGKIFDLLNERLSLMRAVALAKWNNRGAIEDLPREEIVLKNARRSAAKVGLRGTEKLTRTQIEMAKEIQRHWHRRWTREGLSQNKTAPTLAQVRGRLEKIDTQMLSAFPSALLTLRDANQQARLRELFLKRVTQGAFSNSAREELFQAVLQVESAG